MLPKSRRISRHDFPKHRSGGFVLHTENTSLHVTRAKDTRFAAVISKKIASTAVARHQWKRRVYEAIARYEKETTLPHGSYVFFAKKGSESLSFGDISSEVATLLDEARNLIDKSRRNV